jgi:hypothetical protein
MDYRQCCKNRQKETARSTTQIYVKIENDRARGRDREKKEMHRENCY